MFLGSILFGQSIATSAGVIPNGGLVRESLKNNRKILGQFSKGIPQLVREPLNSGYGIIGKSATAPLRGTALFPGVAQRYGLARKTSKTPGRAQVVAGREMGFGMVRLNWKLLI